MITVLHGDDIEASRVELTRLKQQENSVDLRMLDGKTLQEADLLQALESSSLFGGHARVIIENLISKSGKQEKRLERLCKILHASTGEGEVILWEEKEVRGNWLRLLGNDVTSRLFKLPAIVFQFLDNMRPGNSRSSVIQSEKLLETLPAEVFFAMIARRLRQLIALTDGATVKGLAGWQASRLTTQSKFFTVEKLTELYRALGNIEYSIKSGQSALPLKVLIQQFILEI